MFFQNNPLTSTYTLRHLQQRWLQAVMTVGGIALVVFVFAATLMLGQGLQKTLMTTGSDKNILALMTGSQNEVESGISREAANIIESDSEVAKSAGGHKAAAAELVVLVSLKKRSNGEPSNVTFRGIAQPAWELRPAVKMAVGRQFSQGSREIVVGGSVRKRFGGTDIGQQLRFAGINWTIVGVFDASGSAFDSEIWGDVDVMLPAFRREQFSSLTFRPFGGADFEAMRLRLEKDPRLSVALQRERDFYQAQSKDLAAFIEVLGGAVSLVFSAGAIIGAMITMYASVASRVREIGILRALGFSRMLIFSAFLKECSLLGILGGCVGVVLASSLSFFTFATTNFATFADLTFGFELTPKIALYSLGFALLMSVLGGALPALRAARMPIISSIRGD